MILLVITITSSFARTFYKSEKIPSGSRGFAQYARPSPYGYGARTNVLQPNGYGMDMGSTTIMQNTPMNPYQQPSTVIVT
ncbi:hypothetical protein DMENIID0001_031640 [Sergentomyia squamirostris]